VGFWLTGFWGKVVVTPGFSFFILVRRKGSNVGTAKSLDSRLLSRCFFVAAHQNLQALTDVVGDEWESSTVRDRCALLGGRHHFLVREMEGFFELLEFFFPP
jgi:hypothetical protein